MMAGFAAGDRRRLGQVVDVVALWVDEPLRGRGLGTELLIAAEAEARDAGALHAFLETHSFQAPDFYRRLGYVAFAELEDYPPGEQQLFMRKALRWQDHGPRLISVVQFERCRLSFPGCFGQPDGLH